MSGRAVRAPRGGGARVTAGCSGELSAEERRVKNRRGDAVERALWNGFRLCQYATERFSAGDKIGAHKTATAETIGDADAFTIVARWYAATNLLPGRHGNPRVASRVRREVLPYAKEQGQGDEPECDREAGHVWRGCYSQTAALRRGSVRYRTGPAALIPISAARTSFTPGPPSSAPTRCRRAAIRGRTPRKHSSGVRG